MNYVGWMLLVAFLTWLTVLLVYMLGVYSPIIQLFHKVTSVGRTKKIVKWKLIRYGLLWPFYPRKMLELISEAHAAIRVLRKH